MKGRVSLFLLSRHLPRFAAIFRDDCGGEVAMLLKCEPGSEAWTCDPPEGAGWVCRAVTCSDDTAAHWLVTHVIGDA